MKENNKFSKYRFNNLKKLRINKLKELNNQSKYKRKNNKFKSIKFESDKLVKNSNKKNEKKDGNIARKKRMRMVLIFSCIIFLALLIRIGYIQFYKGSELKSMAYIQQTLDRKVNPKRGTIYDATGKDILAISSTVQTVTINPVNIKKDDKEKVAKFLSELFELDYEKTLKKVSKRSSIETIAKKIDNEKADKLRIWLKENNVETGINLDEDTKRYYPYNNLS